jgi:hypothetical protein
VQSDHPSGLLTRKPLRRTRNGDTARLLHRLTSYEPGREWTTPVDDPRVLQDFTPNDLERLPAPCKAYAPGLPAVELPRRWSTPAAPATAGLAGTDAAAAAALDLAGLARVLHLSAGIVRVREYKGRRLLFRAAGSAGARFPLEVYVAARGVAGLADGVYWYDPLTHVLLQVGPPPADGSTTLVVTGIPWRTGWRYSERGFRHLYWDAGTMLAQASALAASAGLGPRLRSVFPDATVTRLVGADGVHEFPLALLTLGEGEPAIRPGGDAATGEVDRAPLEFPLVTRAQHAGDGERLGAPWPAGAALAGEPPPSASLDQVILLRGSTRRMDGSRPVAREVLEWSLAASLRGSQVPHFVAVHAVDGMAPGLYRWPELTSPVRAGDLRQELLHVCVDQTLGQDAAFVVIAVVDAEHDSDGARKGKRQAQPGDVARVHLYRWGDGGSHFHVWLIPRPLGMVEASGMMLPLWEDVLPNVSDEELADAARRVAAAM